MCLNRRGWETTPSVFFDPVNPFQNDQASARRCEPVSLTLYQLPLTDPAGPIKLLTSSSVTNSRS